MRSSERRQSQLQSPCWNSRLTAALWELEDGAEARRRAELSPSECRAYLIHILLTVRQAMAVEAGPFISNGKDTHYAAA